MTGPMTARVANLCDRAAARAGGTLADFSSLRARLSEPLRLAVAGRVKAGKSTLVNALVGRRVAPTSEGECTRVVTCFRYAPDERYEVVGRSGERIVRQLADEGLPDSLPLPPEEIARVDVWLSSDALRLCTILDTPGLSSANSDVSARAREVLGHDEDLDLDSRATIVSAEAVLFVVNQAVREDERQVLRTFRGLSRGADNSPVNAMAVLTKADLIAGTEDPLVAAVELATKHAESLRGEVATVVPLAGLVAETVRSGRFSEADGVALRQLATLEPARLRLLLLSADRFATADTLVAPEARRRLVTTLGLFGVRRAVAAIQAGTASSPALAAVLERDSGFGAVFEGVDEVFRRRADAIKASAALAQLTAISYSGRLPDEDARWLRDEIELLRLDPHMFGLEELTAVEAVLAGRARLPATLADEVTRFGGRADPRDKLGRPFADPRELAEAALAGAQRWRGVASAASPEEARVATIMYRAHHLLWNQLSTSA